MRLLTTTEYLDTPRPQLEWLVQDRVPHPGIVLLLGPEKSGKSFLAFDLALSIAQGKPFLGLMTKKARALYLQFDTSELIWRQRLERMRDAGTDLSGDLFAVHPEDMKVPINIINPIDRAWLKSVVETCDPGITVLDIFREIHSADEDNSTQMKIVGDLLIDIFKGRSLVLVHHSKKFSPENQPSLYNLGNASRGSSYLSGKVDCLWLLYQNQLYIQDRISEPKKLKLMQKASGNWILSPASYPNGKVDPSILKIL